MELALENNGVDQLRARTRASPSTRAGTAGCAGADSADPAQAGRIAQVLRDGYLDIEANSPIVPAEVDRIHGREGIEVSDQQQGIFGIDLGTTYSVVAYIDETGRPAVTRNSDGDDTTPSVVYFETEDNVVVGKAAKASAGVDPDNVVSLIKREMRNKDYTRYFWGKEHSPSSISALILAELATQRRGGHAPGGAPGGDHRARLLRAAGEGRHQEGRGDRGP